MTPRSAYDRARADWEKAQRATERALAEAGFSRAGRAGRRHDHPPRRRDRPDDRPPTRPCLWLSLLRAIADLRRGRRGGHRAGPSGPAGADPQRRVPRRRSSMAQVQAITPKGDPVARTYRVRISLPADTPLMIGMTAETNIVLRQERQCAAAAGEGSAAGSRVACRGRPPRPPARSRSAPRVPRRSRSSPAFREGDRIVARPAPGLKAGQPVRPVLEAGR